ncbi:AMP-binding protein [Actinosynnema sp. NPDC050436]|uniref:AMP-binding protein n=1 Tax=Actinosynnema sp. NPDC050436 TaxID=3155659 RepID=UPI0033FF3459
MVIPESPYRGVGETLVGAFLDHVGTRPDQVAMICRPSRADHVRTTFAGLHRSYSRAVTTFAEAGIGRGTRTAVLVRDPVTLVASIYALTALQAVPILLDAGLPRRALARCLADVAPEAFVGGTAVHAARLLLGWGRHSARIAVKVGDLVDEGSGDGHAVPEPVTPDADGLALLAFTSGSTGPPKAVQYTQRQLAGQAEAAGAVLGIRPGAVAVAGFAPFALYGPALGATIVIPDMDFRKPAEVDPRRLVTTITRCGASVLFGSPAWLNTLARHCVHRRVVLDTVTCVASFGAPMPGSLVDLLARCVPPPALVRSVYGATECLPVCLIERSELSDTRQARDTGAGTCLGKPLPRVSVRIIHPGVDHAAPWSDRLLVPPGQTGEIAVCGPGVSRAYFGRPEADAAAKIRDGAEVVHRTGDLGRLDEQGRVWLAGRKSHRVPTRSGHLDTECVEPACDAVPGVRRTALVDAGVPVLCAEPDGTAEGSDERALVAALRRRLVEVCGIDVVHEVLIHRGLPVDIRHNAKIDRDLLAQWARRRLHGPANRSTGGAS